MPSKQEETAKSIKELIADQNRLLKEQVRIVKEQAGIESDLLSDQQDISNVIKDQITQMKFQRTEKSLLRKITNDINKISQEAYSVGKRQLGVDKQSEIFSKQKVSLEQKIRLLKQQQAKFGKSQNELDQDIAQTIKLQVDEATRLKEQIDGIVASSQKIKDNFGVSTFSTLANAVKSVPGITAFAAPFEAASEAALNTSQDIEHSLKTGEGLTKDMVKKLGLADQLQSKSGETLSGAAAAKKFDKLGKPDGKKLLGTIDRKGFMSAMSGIKSLGKSLSAALGPAALLAALLKALISSDKAAADMAKSMNMTYSEALATRRELTEGATASFNNFVTTKGMQESLMAMSSTLGTNTMLNNEMLVQMTEMREMAGFTNEELAGIGAISLTTGKSMNDITGEFMAQAKMSAMQNGVLLNEKTLLKEIGKVSAATTLSFGKNPALIADAVATAKSLGMELDKVDAIAGSLLDFESSISNELEAELLLNKDINLEKARQAALNNDLATVAREISDQVGSSAEFAEMNRIQQEALAKSVGMNRDDLAETLFIQEQLAGATGEQAKKDEALIQQRIKAVGLAQAQKELAQDGVEGLRQQASMADRLNAALDKLLSVFEMLAEPLLAVFDILSPILQGIGQMVKYATAIGESFGGLGGIFMGLIPILSKAALIARSFAILGFKGAVAAIFRSFSSIPYGLGIPLAIGAVAGLGKLISSGAQKVGDLSIDPNGGPIVSSPREGGIFQGTKNDALRMGPQSALDGGTTVTAQSTDMSATNALLEKLVKKTPEMAPLGLYEVQ